MKDKSHEAHIWYLFHSGFAVKTQDHFLVFDYYKDGPRGKGIRISSDLLSSPDIQDKEILVFSSHGHSDHFNPAIFGWENKDTQIHYVLSRDIEAGKGKDNVLKVEPGHRYALKGVDIEVFDSTDIGVSFLVSCDGIVLFHAGDLNWWHWEGEPEEENDAMAENYKKQIDLLRGREIDLAFIPVDPRLENQYILGLDYFMKVVGADMVFPMHFGKEYSVFQWLKEDSRTAEYRKEIVEITPENQYFIYSRD